MHPALFCAVSSRTPSPSLGRRFFFPNTLPPTHSASGGGIDRSGQMCPAGLPPRRTFRPVQCLLSESCGMWRHCPCPDELSMCCGNALCHVLWGRADSGRVLPTVCVSPSPFLSAPLRWPGPSLFLSHCPTDSVCVCHPCPRGFV